MLADIILHGHEMIMKRRKEKGEGRGDKGGLEWSTEEPGVAKWEMNEIEKNTHTE